jgi:hypothetical protein
VITLFFALLFCLAKDFLVGQLHKATPIIATIIEENLPKQNIITRRQRQNREEKTGTEKTEQQTWWSAVVFFRSVSSASSAGSFLKILCANFSAALRSAVFASSGISCHHDITAYQRNHAFHTSSSYAAMPAGWSPLSAAGSS